MPRNEKYTYSMGVLQKKAFGLKFSVIASHTAFLLIGLIIGYRIQSHILSRRYNYRTDWETVVKEYNCPPCGEKESIEETAKRKCHSNSLHRPDFVEETNILDLHPIPDFLERECKSNPELNPYIKKPIFRRDPIDQDFSRHGYKDRQLVCPEKVWKDDSDLQILVHGGTDQRFAPEKCDHGLPLEKIVTVILEKGNLKKFVELSSFHQLPYGTSSSSITTPYVLIPGDLFDYQASEVNLYRMILEGEVQHADIISGSYVAKDGKWRQSCFHINLKNYALDVYEGYYKSIHGMMYCQGSFGPILVRREIYSNLMKSKKALSQVDLVLFFLQNPDLRTIHCPDCMFHAEPRKELEKSDLVNLARKLMLNKIEIEGNEFKFSCIESGIRCPDLWARAAQNVAQPPCCLELLECVVLASQTEHDRINYDRHCLEGGQAVAAVKMFGNQLPWDTDVDIAESKLDWDKWVNATFEMDKYGIWIRRMVKPNAYQPKKYKHVQVGELNVGGIRGDDYPFKPKVSPCLYKDENERPRTQVLMGGFWINAAKNPGRYARQYGKEYLKHVPWQLADKVDHNLNLFSYEKCRDPKKNKARTPGYIAWESVVSKPWHGCLDQYIPDGNLQFSNHPRH